jgi:hypothetical protein
MDVLALRSDIDAAIALRFFVPLAGKTAKAVAVDLDNTLWGGVIGEDGMTGIQLGPEYPGAAYQEFQRALLRNHGFQLARQDEGRTLWELDLGPRIEPAFSKMQSETTLCALG